MQEPMSLKATRVAFTGIGAVFPEAMAALAERMYFTARRHRAPERERAALEDAMPFQVQTEAGLVHAWRWEPVLPWEKPARGTVLLVHGWEGRASQLGAFVPSLLDFGFTVVGADAPGHGRSPGEAVDLMTYADVIGAVARAAGPVRAIHYAHSFGAAATTLALEGEHLSVDAAVLVSPPCALDKFADTFAKTVGLTRATEANSARGSSSASARTGRASTRSTRAHRRSTRPRSSCTTPRTERPRSAKARSSRAAGPGPR